MRTPILVGIIASVLPIAATSCVDSTPGPRAVAKDPVPAPDASAASVASAGAAGDADHGVLDAGDDVLDAVAAVPARTFRPTDVGPMKPRPGSDGAWIPYSDPEHTDAGTIAFTTTLHPDAKRPLAQVFILAIDRTRTRLFAVAGIEEPKSSATDETSKAYVRPGRIPTEHQPALFAAFNGGFKVQHGGLGMKVDGVTLVPPKDEACTVAGYEDGTLRIGAWSELSETERKISFYRQTPRCLYAHGERHPAIVDEKNIRWGAASNGDTVIRRSAIGLDAQGDTLFVAVSNATTPLAMADAMHHAGAVDVAQLDVNWSFPKLLVYRKNAKAELEAASLFPGFVFTKDEYVRRRSGRDFLYLVRTDLR